MEIHKEEEMQDLSRPFAARQIESRGRARSLRVRVEMVAPGRHYLSRSQSDPRAVHALTRTPLGWVCTCPGFAFTGCCKHLGQVERRSEREGWIFGRIAPRPQSVA
jgi:hypothetical protein